MHLLEIKRIISTVATRTPPMVNGTTYPCYLANQHGSALVAEKLFSDLSVFVVIFLYIFRLYHYILKFMFVGDSQSGKTSLIVRYAVSISPS